MREIGHFIGGKQVKGSDRTANVFNPDTGEVRAKVALAFKGEVEQAQDTELTLLTEIRNILAETNGQSGKHVSGPGTGPSPDTAKTTSADKS